MVAPVAGSVTIGVGIVLACCGGDVVMVKASGTILRANGVGYLRERNDL